MWWLRNRQQSVQELRHAVHELTLRVKRAEDDISQLGASYERLRGRFYSTRGSPGEPPAAAKTKEQILHDFQARQK